MPRPEFCPCENETPDPCPACGATVSGDDDVRGVCQAKRGYRREADVRLVLIDKQTGDIVASTR
jgi:hypothetical protein